MRWPFVSRRFHDLALDAAVHRVIAAEEQRDYWRTRAEKLIDQRLAREGAISEPTMVDRKVSKDPSVAAQMIAAMSVTEIGEQKGQNF